MDLVVLERAFPRHGLRKGDVGTVVETYRDGALEVEFVTAAGKTKALLTLERDDVRRMASEDVLAVRSPRPAPARRPTSRKKRSGARR